LGKPEELASLIAFLASEQAGFISGTAIAVDGGQAAGLFRPRRYLLTSRATMPLWILLGVAFIQQVLMGEPTLLPAMSSSWPTRLRSPLSDMSLRGRFSALSSGDE